MNRPKRVGMLCSLLLKKLTVIALGDDLYRAILTYRSVESLHLVSELCLVYEADSNGG
jgi:hypothetical protein